MASLARCHPETLTDRDITTVRAQRNAAALMPVEQPRSVFTLTIERGAETMRLRFVLPVSPAPKWASPNLVSASQVLSLPSNWDQQGASPVNPAIVTRAMNSLATFMSDDAAIAQWTPTPLSGVQLDWHEKGVDLELSFEPDQKDGYAVFSDNANPGNEWDGPISAHVEDLRALFRERLTS
jgi:hypothetical protein